MDELGIAEQAVAAGYPQAGSAVQGHPRSRARGHSGHPSRGREVSVRSRHGAAGPARRAHRRGAHERRQSQARPDVRDDRRNRRMPSTSRSPTAAAAATISSSARTACARRCGRRSFPKRPSPRFTGQGVWRYNVPRPPEVTRTFMCMGLEGGKCGFCPLTPTTGYVILVQSEPGNPRHPADKLADIMRGRLAACTGLMAQLRDQITDPSQVVYRPLEAVFVPAPWYRGRVLLIGDAVHATTPHMGQGAAQAVEDAVVLGQVFAQNLPIEQAARPRSCSAATSAASSSSKARCRSASGSSGRRRTPIRPRSRRRCWTRGAADLSTARAQR